MRIKRAALVDSRLRAVSFSRNFGKEIALAAGLDHAHGRAVVMIDADLQHPPETIATFVEKWREGYDMVFGQRVDRSTDGPIRRWMTGKFYALFAHFGETPLPPGAGDYRLMDRKVVDALRRLGERARFSKGLYAWVGFKSIGVPFEVQERLHGTSKWGYRQLTRFAFDGLSSFSTLPLKLATYIGLGTSIFAFTYAITMLLRTMVLGVDVPGFPSLIVSVMFFSGIQLVFLGVIGEYIGRIFAEVKRRPLYIVAEEIGGRHGARDGHGAAVQKVQAPGNESGTTMPVV
jgi:glycosyltransferase involved in cell wall biosynthesis